MSDLQSGQLAALDAGCPGERVSPVVQSGASHVACVPPLPCPATRLALSTPEDLVAFAELFFSGFDHAFEQAPLRLSRCIGGSMFEIRTTLPDQHAILDRGIAQEPESAPADCRLLVACAGTIGLPETPCWAHATYHELQVETALAHSPYRVHHAQELGFWQFFCLKTRRGVQLLQTPASLPPWDSGAPLRNFFQWQLASRTAGLVHAGVLGLDGRGVLLLGPGGSGKSGTVLAGILNGLLSVGDDYVLLKNAATVTAMPVFTTLKCDPAGLARVGIDPVTQSAPWAQTVNWQGKCQFALKDISSVEQPHQIQIDALCLPEVALASHTTLEPINSKEVFLSLAPTGIAQIPGGRAQNFAFCADLSRRLPAFRIKLGRDPMETTQAITTLLHSLRR